MENNYLSQKGLFFRSILLPILLFSVPQFSNAQDRELICMANALHSGTGNYDKLSIDSVLHSEVVASETALCFEAAMDCCFDVADDADIECSHTDWARFPKPDDERQMNFNAFVAGSMVNLEWSATPGFNTDYFTLEKSGTGKAYDLFAIIKGNGNTITKTMYSYTDQSPLAGTSWYRLSQSDYEGRVEYFNPVIVKIEASKDAVASAENYTITEGEKAGKTDLISEININNSMGKEVLSIKVSNPSTSVFMDLVIRYMSTLNPDFYQLTIKTKEDTYYESVVITE